MELNRIWESKPEWLDGGVIVVLCEDEPFTAALPVDTGWYRGALTYHYVLKRYRLALRRDRRLTVRYGTLDELVAWLDAETEAYLAWLIAV